MGATGRVLFLLSAPQKLPSIVTSCRYKLWKVNMWGVIGQRNGIEILIYIHTVIPDQTENGIIESSEGLPGRDYKNPELPGAAICRGTGEVLQAQDRKTQHFSEWVTPQEGHITKADFIIKYCIKILHLSQFLYIVFNQALQQPFSFCTSKKRRSY